MNKNVFVLLKKLVNFKTVSNQSNEEMINFLQAYFQRLNFKVKRIKGENNKFALIAQIGDLKKKGIIFSAHTDTVPPSEKWSTDPFFLKIKRNKLFGLGVADMKGAITSYLLLANKIAKMKNLTMPIYFVFSYNEETDFSGIKRILNQQKFNAKLCVIGEPTNLKPIIASKGLLSYRLIFKGKEAHGAYPKKGINAIEAASEFIFLLKDQFIKQNRWEDRIFDPPFCTFNIGKISGGESINTVAGEAIIEFEFRTINQESSEMINNLVNNLTKKIKKIFPGLKILTSKIADLPSIWVNKKLTITKKRMGSVNYITEATFFVQKNIPTVILGPGDFKQAHKSDESINKGKIESAVKVYLKILS